MDDKEVARKHATPMVVYTHPDVCKSPTAPVPYPIVAPLTPSVGVASTVRATRVPTFTMKSYIPVVVGDEAGVGMGVKSCTHAGTGRTWPTGSSSTVRAEKAQLVRNGDAFQMNGGNNPGKLVYQPGSAPRAGVDAANRPTANANPDVAPTPQEQGWLDWASSKAKGAVDSATGAVNQALDATAAATNQALDAAAGAVNQAWDATSAAAGQAWQYGQQLNQTYKIVPRALGGVQAVGGAGEIALGAVGLAAPTGVTQVVGGVAVVHGVDTTSTGLRQLWTGNFEQTLTEQAATNAAAALGASPGTAGTVGMVTDLAAGLVNPANIGRKVLTEGAESVTREAAEGLTKKLGSQVDNVAGGAAKKEAKEVAGGAAAREGDDGVRVFRKPVEPPDTSKVKYPDDMSPYKTPDGKDWDWDRVAPNKGFAGTPAADTLQPGTVIDRYGGDGRFFSPAGTPFEARALPPTSLPSAGSPYRAFEVLRPIPVQSGGIAPAFGMPGGGTQFFTGGLKLSDLLEQGYVRQVYP